MLCGRRERGVSQEWDSTSPTGNLHAPGEEREHEPLLLAVLQVVPVHVVRLVRSLRHDHVLAQELAPARQARAQAEEDDEAAMEPGQAADAGRCL